jgi:hypothetical protein
MKAGEVGGGVVAMVSEWVVEALVDASVPGLRAGLSYLIDQSRVLACGVSVDPCRSP